LPRRQEIEIRRRSAAFDIPIRGIIRARWELSDYEMNLGLADSLFTGLEIVAVTPARRDSFPWGNSLAEDLAASEETASLLDLDEARTSLSVIAGGRLPVGLPTSRIGASSLSELIKFNRIEGLSIGLGWSFRSSGGATSGKILARYGFDDGDPQGRLELSIPHRSSLFSIDARSLITEMGDRRVVSGLLGSLLAQEAGRDLGDYYRLQLVGIGMVSDKFGLDLRVQRVLGVSVSANSTTGSFRENPYLDADWYPGARLRFATASADYGNGNRSSRSVELESGLLNSHPFARLLVSFDEVRNLGPMEIRSSGWLGLATNHLPAHRTFVLGGWGTLIGESFRSWGGRKAAFGHLELGRKLPFPGVAVSGSVATGAGIYAAPFVSVGWTRDPPAGYPWLPTGRLRGVVGVALEPLGGLVRIMLGRNLSEKSFGITVDITRELWGVL
jgi:hypothetical protein